MSQSDTKIAPISNNFDIYGPGSVDLVLQVRGGVVIHPTLGLKAVTGIKLTLVASDDNYVEATDAGVISVNQTGFSASANALYIVTTNADRVTGIEDWRGSGRVVEDSTSIVHGRVGIQIATATANGAIRDDADSVSLDHASVIIAATIAAPRAGRRLVLRHGGLGTTAHTVTLTAGTYDGSATIVTFNALDEALVLFGVSATRFLIVENLGGAVLS